MRAHFELSLLERQALSDSGNRCFLSLLLANWVQLIVIISAVSTLHEATQPENVVVKTVFLHITSKVYSYEQTHEEISVAYL